MFQLELGRRCRLLPSGVEFVRVPPVYYDCKGSVHFSNREGVAMLWPQNGYCAKAAIGSIPGKPGPTGGQFLCTVFPRGGHCLCVSHLEAEGLKILWIGVMTKCVGDDAVRLLLAENTESFYNLKLQRRERGAGGGGGALARERMMKGGEGVGANQVAACQRGSGPGLWRGGRARGSGPGLPGRSRRAGACRPSSPRPCSGPCICRTQPPSPSAPPAVGAWLTDRPRAEGSGGTRFTLVSRGGCGISKGGGTLAGGCGG